MHRRGYRAVLAVVVVLSIPLWAPPLAGAVGLPPWVPVALFGAGVAALWFALGLQHHNMRALALPPGASYGEPPGRVDFRQPVPPSPEVVAEWRRRHPA